MWLYAAWYGHREPHLSLLKEQEVQEHLGTELAHAGFKTQPLIGQELAEDQSWNHRSHIHQIVKILCVVGHICNLNRDTEAEMGQPGALARQSV